MSYAEDWVENLAAEMVNEGEDIAGCVCFCCGVVMSGVQGGGEVRWCNDPDVSYLFSGFGKGGEKVIPEWFVEFLFVVLLSSTL